MVASCPRCRSIPSFERFLSVPCCRTVRALITLAAARHLARCANGRRCAHSARGPLPALSVPLSGPQLPEAPPRASPGERLSLRSVVATLRFCRLPPATGNSRHAPWALRPQAARGGGSSRARFGGLAAGARVCQGAFIPRRPAAFIGRWRLWGAPGFALLRSGHPIGLLPCGRPPRARRGRRTPLSSRRRPKRFCPLEPLSPHAACARTRPPFGRPLPRFRGLAPRGSFAAVGSLSD